jgi:deazaflavin-dependent oxidoreductase (nitroreductase family)
LAAKLRYVDPTRSPSIFVRAYAALAASRFARFISRHINWKLDPLLLRVTRGRLATTLVFPTALLETRGARSGATRRNAIIYFHDGERVTIAASNAGAARHPAWYHNLKAHPDVVFAGILMRATVIDDQDETERLWELADRVFPAYANYRRAAAVSHRTIPLVQLTPRRQSDATARRSGAGRAADELSPGTTWSGESPAHRRWHDAEPRASQGDLYVHHRADP